MSISFNNVCRLCLAADNLLSILNDVDENMKMKDIVYFATGIVIHITDAISQKICNNCYEFTVKMFQFRSQCVKSEKYLKEQLKKHSKNSKSNIPNTQVTIRNELKQSSDKPSKKPLFSIHPSIAQLAKAYPHIKLPVLCLKSHVTPVVVMELDEVESYFKKRNLNINVYIKSALKSSRKANRLVKLKEVNTNTEQNTLIGGQQLTNNSINGSNKCTKVVNTKKSLKSSTINEKDVNTKTKRNFVTKAVMKTPQVNTNSFVISKKPAEVGGINKSIKIHTVRQCLKKVNTSNKKKIKIKFPFIKRQKDISNQFNGKRKSSEIAMKRVIKRPRLLDMTPKSTGNPLNINDLSESLSEVHNTTDTTKTLPQRGTVPSVSKDNPSQSLSYIDKSVPLHICNICNSVQYSAKHLRRHRIDHLRCQFCKVRFRTLPNKIHHIENLCMFKKAMTNMPDIEVEKIEYDIEVRRKYPEAFINFPSIPPFETENSIDLTQNDNVDLLKLDITHKFKTILDNMSNLSSRSNIELTKQTVTDINNIPAHLLDVIEILSDDEESSNTSSRSHIKDFSPDKSTNQLATCEDDNVQHSPLLSPNVNIRNHRLLNGIDLTDYSDINIMKKLLICSLPMHGFNQRYTQTHLPLNQDIIVFEGNVILKGLKRHMRAYKIPVVTRFGKLRVSYDYNKSPKQHNKLCFWNDLTPIDIKQTEYKNNPVESDRTSNSLETTTLRSHSSSVMLLSINQNCTVSTVNDSLQPQSDVQTSSVIQTNNALALLNFFSDTDLGNEAGNSTNEDIRINDIELI